MSEIERCDECGSPADALSGGRLCVCGGPGPTAEEAEIVALRQQLEGAGKAFEDFIAEVAAPTGRLRLAEHAEGEPLYESVKRARSTLAALKGQSASFPETEAS